MKKRTRVLDEEVRLDFDQTQMVLWSTYYLNYQFVDQLNRIYRLELARDKNVGLLLDTGKSATPVECPCFIYGDERTCLLYIVVELPRVVKQKSILDRYDKLLLIQGRDSGEKVQEIYHDMEGREEPPEVEVLQHLRWEQARDFMAEGILQADYLNLSDPEVYDSSILVGGYGMDEEKKQKMRGQLAMSMCNIMRALSQRLDEIEDQSE